MRFFCDVKTEVLCNQMETNEHSIGVVGSAKDRWGRIPSSISKQEFP